MLKTAAFLFSAVMMLSGCSGGLLFSCHAEVLDSVASPSGKLVALVSSTDCGATTAATLEVSIVSPGSPPPKEPNTLATERGAPYSAYLRPVWLKDDKLLVSIPNGARIFTDNAKVGAVDVVYKEP